MHLELTPWQDSRAMPIETIMRLAGRSTFVTPGGGRARRHHGYTGPIDIAHALATASDELGGDIAMGVACPANAKWGSIEARARVRLLGQLRATWRYGTLIAGTKERRLIVVTRHSMADLVRGHRVAAYWGARAAHMRKADYGVLYGYVAAELERLAGEAASEACNFLFGRIETRNTRAIAPVARAIART